MPDTRVWTKPKGHWPKGKLRNPWTRGDWPSLRDRVVNLLKAHPLPGERSGNALAVVLGIDPTTMHRYLRGRHHPRESLRTPILAWLKRQESMIRRGT